MNDDFWRLAGILVVSLIVGWLTGQVLVCLVIGLSGYIYWHYQLLQSLLHWLRRRSDNDPPEHPGVIEDITREIDYLRAHHKQRKEKLSGFLRRFQEATAALPDAVIVLGEYNRIEWANALAAEYLDVHWPQDSGQRLVNLIRNPDLSQFLRESGNNIAEKRLQIVVPDKPELRLELRLSPYGEKQRLLVARDITKIHQAEQMRKDFIANASHELRTPLTVISGYLESMEDDIDSSKPMSSVQVKQMRSQAERMRRLIEDLLKLASLESDENASDTGVIHVPDILASLYKEAITVSGAQEHVITLDSEPDLWLTGNYNELYSAFSNLIFNAIQYTPENGVIKIRWYADDDGAHFEIIDSGIGIAPEHIPRLTERFYRADKGRSRDKGGTGLGLAIVKHVLVRHDAALEVESKLGKGSTFRCNFPKGSIVYREDPAAITLKA